MKRILMLGGFGLLLAGCNSTNNEALKKLQEGCLLDSDCETPLVCAFRRCHVRCNEDRDCPTGQACRPADRPYNVCVAKLECTRDSDCDPGLVCAADNICRSECQANRDCLADQICIAGVCAREAELANGQLPRKSDAGTFACNYNSECPPAQVCNRGRCLPECVTNADCSFGFSCNQGACTPLDGGGKTCNLNSECGNTTPPQICSNTGRCIAECVENRDCRADQTCNNSLCVAKSDGGAGTLCSLNSDCMDPKFPRCGPLGVCGPECKDNRDCTPPAVCALGDAGYGNCRVPGSDGGTAPACSLNSDCTDPQFPRCSPQGRCVVDCYFNVDCGPSFTCVGSVTDAGANNKGGACTPAQTATDGGSGQLCNLNSDCTNPDFPRCGPQGRCTVECLFNVDCASGFYCQGSITDGGTADGGNKGGRCTQVPVDAGILGAPCSLNSDCNGNLRCTGGTCAFQCVKDIDCNGVVNQCCIYNLCRDFQTCSARTADGGLPPQPDAGLPDGGGLPDAGCVKDLDCQDGVFCNGFEFCQSGACRTASRVTCDDNNPCSLDMCSEVNRTCSYSSTLVDNDGDGHYPVTCGGSADDCDDNEPNTWGGSLPALERCDFKDNNCNGNVDENLWKEKPNSRVTIYPGGLYPPGVGGPRLKVAGDVLYLVANSDQTVRGSADVFTFEAATLNLSSGPAPAFASGSTVVSCSSVGGNTPGQTAYLRRVGRADLHLSDAGELLVAGTTKTYSGGACCTTAPARAQSLYSRSPLSPLQFDGGGELHGDTANTTCFLQESQATDPGQFAWNGRSGRYDVVYTTVVESIPLPPQSGCTSGCVNASGRWLMATTMDLQGKFTTPHRLLDNGAGVQGAYVGGNTSNVDSRWSWKVAVGPTGVLVMWDQQSIASSLYAARLRYAFFNDTLSQLIAGPFDFPAGTYGLPASARDVEDLQWDGTQFIATVAQGASQQAYFLRLGASGAASPPALALPSPGSVGLGLTDHFPSTAQSHVALSTGGNGIFTATTSNTGLRFGWGRNAIGSPLQVAEVAVGAPLTHSDFRLFPVDPTHVAVFYTDGDLKRLSMECKP